MKKASIFLLLFFFALQAHAQSVDILWQGDTYTPPFYKGLSLWSNQSKLYLLAVPEGLGNPKALNYRWSRNGTVYADQSGVGVNTFSFTDSIISRPQKIDVDIISSEGDVIASGSASIASIQPVVHVYQNSPLYGILFNSEVSGTLALKDPEVTFTACPFFFSAFSRADNSLSYDWQTNAGQAESKDSVTFRAPDGGSGLSNISVAIQSQKKVLQSANAGFLIKFGEQ